MFGKYSLGIPMAKQKSVDEITDDAIREGGYLVNAYFDLHASTEEAVKTLMVGFISKLTKEEGVIYAVGEIDQAEKKDDMYSTWACVKLLAKDFPVLVRISVQYSPIGWEILRPQEVRLSIGEVQSALIDISQFSQNFTRLIMEKTLSKEEAQKYARKMMERAELGRKLLDRAQKK